MRHLLLCLLVVLAHSHAFNIEVSIEQGPSSPVSVSSTTTYSSREGTGIHDSSFLSQMRKQMEHFSKWAMKSFDDDPFFDNDPFKELHSLFDHRHHRETPLTRLHKLSKRTVGEGKGAKKSSSPFLSIMEMVRGLASGAPQKPLVGIICHPSTVRLCPGIKNTWAAMIGCLKARLPHVDARCRRILRATHIIPQTGKTTRQDKSYKSIKTSSTLSVGDVCKSGGIETGPGVQRANDCPAGSTCQAKKGVMSIGGEVPWVCTATGTPDKGNKMGGSDDAKITPAMVKAEAKATDKAKREAKQMHNGLMPLSMSGSLAAMRRQLDQQIAKARAAHEDASSPQLHAPTLHKKEAPQDKHGYFLARGGESCDTACKHKGATCNVKAIQAAAKSVLKCKQIIEGLPIKDFTPLRPQQGGQYTDDNSGCTYQPDQLGWYQVMRKDGPPNCAEINADIKRQRVCACSAASPSCEDDIAANHLGSGNIKYRKCPRKGECTVPKNGGGSVTFQCTASGWILKPTKTTKTPVAKPPAGASFLPATGSTEKTVWAVSAQRPSWWTPMEIKLDDCLSRDNCLEEKPVTITYEVRPDSSTSECIGAFSHTMKPWRGGGHDEDALTWYGAPHRKDFGFRTRVFKGFPDNTQFNTQTIKAGVWHQVEVKLTKHKVTYKIDEHVFATADIVAADGVPLSGHVGMMRYASDYSFRNLVVKNEAGVVVYPQAAPSKPSTPHKKKPADETSSKDEASTPPTVQTQTDAGKNDNQMKKEHGVHVITATRYGAQHRLWAQMMDQGWPLWALATVCGLVLGMGVFMWSRRPRDDLASQYSSLTQTPDSTQLTTLASVNMKPQL